MRKRELAKEDFLFSPAWLERQRATRDGTERQQYYYIYTPSNSQLVLRPSNYEAGLTSVITGWFLFISKRKARTKVTTTAIIITTTTTATTTTTTTTNTTTNNRKQK
jgi:hypothetical protein